MVVEVFTAFNQTVEVIKFHTLLHNPHTQP